MDAYRLTPRKARLIQAHRLVSESAARIERQEVLVGRIAVEGSAELAGEARDMLQNMREFHAVIEQVLQNWVESAGDGMSTAGFPREPLQAAEAQSASPAGRAKKPRPTRYCRMCAAPGYPVSGDSHRCAGRRRPGTWMAAESPNDWETCIWCDGTGEREGRACGYCGGVGWRLVTN